MKKAEDITGWMSVAELAELRRRAALVDTVVEIGSWQGRSTAAFAEACPGTVWAIDWFQGNALESGDRNCAQAAYNGHGQLAYHAFLQNLDEYLKKGKVRLLSFPSTFGLRYLHMIGVKPDLIFIDGSHTAEAVWLDILHAKSLLAPQGYLLGHDWSEVQQAVRQILPEALPVEVGDLWEWHPPDVYASL